MPEIPRDLRFDHGIEFIIDADEPASVGLPDTTNYVPGDVSLSGRLTEILQPPTVEEQTLDSFRPECHHKQLLTPNGFHQAHDRCQFDMQQQLETLRGTPEGDKVARLIEFLDEKQDLADLLSTLRQLLQQA